MWFTLFKVWNHVVLDYYDLVSVSKVIVVSHSNSQIAVTFTINTEQVCIGAMMTLNFMFYANFRYRYCSGLLKFVQIKI